MPVIIDYGVGNLFSLTSYFKFIGQDVTVTSDKKKIAALVLFILMSLIMFSFANPSGELKPIDDDKNIIIDDNSCSDEWVNEMRCDFYKSYPWKKNQPTMNLPCFYDLRKK